MSKKSYLIITLAASLVSLQASSFDPNPEEKPGYVYQEPTITGDLDNFADEKVLVLYRGINFLENQFTKQKRLDYINTDHVGVPMYSSAAYELAGADYSTLTSIDLDQSAITVADEINALNEQDSCEINGREFDNPRYALQQLYSNNYKGFFSQLTNPEGDYQEIFEDFSFTKNPLLSFSHKLKHPCKYGFGLKNYGSNTALLPKYQTNGKPKHPIIGKLFGIVLDEAAIEELMPLNVKKAHDSNALKLKTHFRNDILSEREISIAGHVPAECVVFEMDLQAPSFAGTYKTYYKLKYGLSKTRYNNYQKIFTSTTQSQAVKQSKTTELLNSIIEAPYPDNAGTYKYTYTYALSSLFEESLDTIGAEISSLTLDYRLE